MSAANAPHMVYPKGTSCGDAEALPSGRSTIESVDTVCLPHATDGPKSRKLHPGAHVEKSARLPSEPPYKSQFPKGGFGTGAPPKPNKVGLVGRGGATE